MPRYRYSARDTGGVAVRGELEAANRKLAVQKLMAQQLKPVSVTEAAIDAADRTTADRGRALGRLFGNDGARPVKLNRNLALPFLTGLKELLACGIQAGDALQLMSARLNDPAQKRLATLLWDDIRQGRSLSEAFRKQNRVFDDSIVSLVEAGEATGSLTNVLNRLIANLEETKAIKAKLASALAYPLFLIVIAFGLVLLFLFFLLPRIENLLTSLGGNLPLSTKVLISSANFAISYGWIIGIAVIFGVVSILSWRRTATGRRSFDEFILRIPMVGRFLRDLQVLRLCQVLGLLLENGITMVQALALTERSLGNRAMKETFGEARAKVTEGSSLSGAFRTTGYFEGMALDVFTVGESTGNVVPGLKQMARQYGERVDATIKAFLGSISVGVLLFVFAFVGLIAFGIISAVLQLSTSLST